MYKRGDILLCSMSSDFGKVRPAVVVQNTLFNEVRNTITMCPLTTELIEEAVFRPTIKPTEESGLKTTSQIMVDKICSIKKERLKKNVGKLTEGEKQALDESIKLWLGL